LLRRNLELENPIFVVQVDRNDLDKQLYDRLVSARHLIGDVKAAESIEELRDLLRTRGGEVICSTIQKFRLKTKEGIEIEKEHPVLNESDNIIIIADEAHRTQYGFDTGFARYLYEALPNASRLGFTGTPISFSGADTVEVFGELIHTYDIKQAQEDNVTVPIYYVPRQIRLNIKKEDIDKAFEEITDDYEIDRIEQKKSKWTALASAAGAKERLKVLAGDLLNHFINRTSTLEGKAMVVCMTRENCVKLYDALTELPDCPEIKIVMTGRLGEDPEAWSKAGHITTKKQREAIKEKMKDINDPLKIVIVCDMWLTGTDIPCLHTLYIDKPMKGHNMIQDISRVNRVFMDKPHGLIVDYIGIVDELREATSKYTKGGGKGDPAPDIKKQAIPLFLQCLKDMRSTLPGNINYGDWRKLGHIDLEDRYSLIFGLLTDSDERRDDFLQLEYTLSKAFSVG
jgi:type I restriction enzyme R subunit